MDRFYIITNSDKDSNLAITGKITEYLKAHGRSCEVQQAERKHEGAYHYTDPSKIPDDTQCIIVLGGDGTLLQAARDVVHKEIPLLGINLGHLGFLAEVDQTSLYSSLDQLMADDYEVEERMMLEGRVYRGKELIGDDIALNDIVIGRDGHLRVVRFKNYVNDVYLNSYNADGIIISTPTGSTGYSLSAGGPIVSPNAAMTIMTPIAPHTLNMRSIIFPAQDVITVEIGKGRHCDCEKGIASFDGDTFIPMVTGDCIQIRQADVKTKILKLNHLSFVEVLRRKMRDSLLAGGNNVKVARHEKIIELIHQYDIDTQEELASRLNEAGFKVTQATVSRDIRALKLTKVAGKDGKSRYAIINNESGSLGAKYTRVLEDTLLSIDVGQNIIVIKTVSGMAMGVAAALDALKWPEILGCIAGDDTIMCAAKNADMALGAAEKLRSFVRLNQ